MLAREILKKVKQIEIRTRGLVDSFLEVNTTRHLKDEV